MKRIIITNAVALVLYILNVLPVQAQDSAKTHNSFIQQKIENKAFTFVANWVNPMTGAGRQLTNYYTLTIHKDSLIADLPYFGQSYTAPIDPTKIGINLNETDFNYSFIKKKKGRWDISIHPKNQSEIQSFLLTIYDDGTAYLNVTCSNRSPISYRGYIEEKK